MAGSYAIYQDTPNGRFRVGVWRYRGNGVAVRVLSEAYHQQHPNARDGGRLYIAKRRRLMGEWVDGPLAPMDAPHAAITPAECERGAQGLTVDMLTTPGTIADYLGQLDDGSLILEWGEINSCGTGQQEAMTNAEIAWVRGVGAEVKRRRLKEEDGDVFPNRVSLS